MADSHTSIERFTVGSYARTRKLWRRHVLWQRQRRKHRLLHQLSGSVPQMQVKLAVNEYDAEDLDSSFSDMEDMYFLQPLTTRQRRRMLKIAGVGNIDMTEMLECNGIRSSREICGCDCRMICDPKTCLCSLAGIKCQVDRMSFPCGCTKEGCSNPFGRVEFNPLRVRMHLLHTLMRHEIQRKKEGNFHADSTAEDFIQHRILMDEMPTDESSGEEDSLLSEGELKSDENDQECYSNAIMKFNSNEQGSCRYCQNRESMFVESRRFFGNNQMGHDSINCGSNLVDTTNCHMLRNVASSSVDYASNSLQWSLKEKNDLSDSDDSSEECYFSNSKQHAYDSNAFVHMQSSPNKLHTKFGSQNVYRTAKNDHLDMDCNKIQRTESSISEMLSPLRFMQTDVKQNDSVSVTTTELQSYNSSVNNDISTSPVVGQPSQCQRSCMETNDSSNFIYLQSYGDHADYFAKDSPCDSDYSAYCYASNSVMPFESGPISSDTVSSVSSCRPQKCTSSTLVQSSNVNYYSSPYVVESNNCQQYYNANVNEQLASDDQPVKQRAVVECNSNATHNSNTICNQLPAQTYMCTALASEIEFVDHVDVGSNASILNSTSHIEVKTVSFCEPLFVRETADSCHESFICSDQIVAQKPGQQLATGKFLVNTETSDSTEMASIEFNEVMKEAYIETVSA